MSRARRRPAVDAAILVGLALGGFAMVLPFLWMISTSLKSLEEALRIPPTWIPEHPRWGNYARLFTPSLNIGRMFLNSLQIAGLSTLGALLSCSMAAFALARLRFPGRNALFLAALATLMIPWQVTWIPVFVLFTRVFGWKDTLYPLWVPAFFGSGFGIFLLRQFFLGMPRDLEDAAVIDGSTPLGIYWRIALPLAKPALVTLGIFTFLWSWNDLLGPLIYVDSLDRMPLTAGLTFLQGQSIGDWPLQMAGALVATLPIVIIFLLAQETFVKGITLTGLKG
jgi:multiple sugar transport system permease protein